jgi:putative transposase
MEYKRQGHSVYYTRYHLVITTKYRRKIFNEGTCAYLKLTIQSITKYYPEIRILEINTDQDHAHILISIPPKISISQAVNIIKSNTAAALRKKFEYLDKVHWDFNGIWSIGYFVSTVGINENIIQQYISYQGTEDSGQAKLELG